MPHPPRGSVRRATPRANRPEKSSLRQQVDQSTNSRQEANRDNSVQRAKMRSMRVIGWNERGFDVVSTPAIDSESDTHASDQASREPRIHRVKSFRIWHIASRRNTARCLYANSRVNFADARVDQQPPARLLRFLDRRDVRGSCFRIHDHGAEFPFRVRLNDAGVIGCAANPPAADVQQIQFHLYAEALLIRRVRNRTARVNEFAAWRAFEGDGRNLEVLRRERARGTGRRRGHRGWRSFLSDHPLRPLDGKLRTDQASHPDYQGDGNEDDGLGPGGRFHVRRRGQQELGWLAAMRTISRQAGVFGGEIELPTALLALAPDVFSLCHVWHAIF